MQLQVLSLLLSLPSSRYCEAGVVLKHGVCHRTDQVERYVDAVEITKVPGDLPGAHAWRIHRHDLVVETGKPALVLRSISCGSKLDWRSRGTSISSLPFSVVTVFRP